MLCPLRQPAVFFLTLLFAGGVHAQDVHQIEEDKSAAKDTSEAAEKSVSKDTSLTNEIEEFLDKTEPSQVLAIWRAGPLFGSTDGVFSYRLRYRALVDYYGSTSDDFGSPVDDNGVFVRQARIGVLGRMYGHVLYGLNLDFGRGDPALIDVFVGLADLGRFGTILFGHQREPFGLEGTTPVPFLPLMERASSTRAFALGRNVGIRLHDVVMDGRMTWWAGVFRETNRFAQGNGSGGYTFTARVTGLAIRDTEDRLLHLGVSFTFRNPANDTTRYRARHGPAQGERLVDTGQITANREVRTALEGALRLGPLVLQSEGYFADVSGLGADANFWGAYFTVSYWLTGEAEAYSESAAVWDRVTPKRFFHDGTDGKGAWMVALRFDHVDLTDGGIDGGEMDTISASVTWLWNPNSRVKFTLVYADVDGGPEGSGSIVTGIFRFQWDF
ncbi:MAG: OprO/OprP family phosphate-selective porin [Planctomycetota bacterium]